MGGNLIHAQEVRGGNAGRCENVLAHIIAIAQPAGAFDHQTEQDSSASIIRSLVHLTAG